MQKLYEKWICVAMIASFMIIAGCGKGEADKSNVAPSTSRVRFQVLEKGDKLEFYVDNEAYELGELSQPKEFSVGEHLVTVRRDGEVLFKVPFDVTASEDVMVVDVISPMRTAALAIIEAGGKVRTVDPESEVKEASAVPSDYFEFDGVIFYRKQFDDSVLEVLKTIDGFRLKELDASFSNISDKGIQSIEDLSQLEGIGLIRSSVTSEGLKLIANAGPPLRRVLVDGLELPEEFLNHLKNCQLDIFGASDTNVSDKDLANLKSKFYWDINLARTKVTDEGLKALAGTKVRRTLDLSGTAISDEGIKHCLKLEELKAINLTNTRVTEAGIKLLRERFPEIKITHSSLE